MWSRRDLNSRPLLRLFIEKLSADLATNLPEDKSSTAAESILARHSPSMFLSNPGSRIRGALRDRVQSDSFSSAETGFRGEQLARIVSFV